MRIDPDGLRDIYVAIWNAQAPYIFGHGSVGHAGAFETNGRVILSQFPDPHGMRGSNTRLSYSETVLKEGRSPDAAFKVFVPDDKQFDSVAVAKANASTWYALPVDTSETNCVNAIAKALTAGGVPIDQPDYRPGSPVTPGQMQARLSELMNGGGQQWSVQAVAIDVLGPRTKPPTLDFLSALQTLESVLPVF
jgi:hypothetical protein